MDPFSITVGAVGLVDAANKVTTALIDRYQAFHSAPKQMQEIADQITLCAGLVDVFAKSVDGSGVGVREFPEKFLVDAKSLVGQCHGILKEIEKMIPRGSQKPGYTERLRFAFGDEKKILKQQEKLKQKPESNLSSTADIPAGNFTGFMQHMPLQINIKDPNASAESTGFEATLTLKPIKSEFMSFEVSNKKKKEAEKRETRDRRKSSAKQTKNEKQVLENMRRSPYFCTSVLSRPAEARTYSAPGGIESLEVERTKLEEARRAEKRAKKDLYDEHAEVVVKVDECLSSEQAAVGVDNILSEWFHHKDADLSNTELDHVSSQRPNTSRRPSNKSPSPRPPTIEVVTVEPPSSSSSSQPPSPIPTRTLYPSSSGQRLSNTDKSSTIGRRHSNPDRPQSLNDRLPLRRTRSRNWKCHGCGLGYFNTDRRYKCINCSADFNFCQHCYEDVWHRHPKSNFRSSPFYNL